VGTGNSALGGDCLSDNFCRDNKIVTAQDENNHGVITDPLPDSALNGARFAESIAQRWEAKGGKAADLFVAISGLISGKSPIVGAECLIALERAVDDSLISKSDLILRSH
jgi:hypothetical protein